MTFPLRSELVGTSGLLVAAVAALVLVIVRTPLALTAGQRRQTITVFVVCVTLQALHFFEEYSTSFYERFPQSLGLSAWSPQFFVVLNLSCFFVWLLAGFGLRAGKWVAFFPVWFLAIAMMVNGIVHPLLAIRAGSYFPGLVTAPLVGIAGVVMWSRLRNITAPL